MPPQLPQMQRPELNILHLSDLHYVRGAYDQSRVIDALLKDLVKTCRGASKPDLVIFSGDIAKAGDVSDIYYASFDELLTKIVGAVGCTEQRIFLCPGNHDAQRAVIESELTVQNALLMDLTGRDVLNERYLSGEIGAFAKQKFERFRELNEFFGNQTPALDDGIVRVDCLPDLPVDVVTVNSAWLTSAGIKGLPKDRDRLLVPEAAMAAARKLLRHDTLHILVTHHPNDWLAESCRVDFENTIDGYFDLHLFGHMHDPNPKNVVTPKGACVLNQAGALYQGRKRYNGYSLLSLDPTRKLVRVRARSYFPKPDQFDDGVDVLTNGGIFYSSEESKAYWRARAKLVDIEDLAAWLSSDFLAAASAAFNEGIADRTIEDVFVPPPMKLKTGPASERDGVPDRDQSPITLKEIVANGTNYVVYGKKDYGKTTLLQQAAISIARRATDQATLPSIPIILDFAALKKGDRAVLRALKSAVVCELPGVDLTTLLENGFVTVLVDDVDFNSQARWNLLKGFLKEFPRNRFIFTSTPGCFDGIIAAFGEDMVVDPGTAQHFEHVFIDVFNRAKLRHLVKLWDPSGMLDQERILNRLVTEMTSLNIPITAVNGTILLTIYEEKADFRPINRAALIEQFVEHALEKRSPEAVFRSSLDYKNKEFLLSELASAMAEAGEYILSTQQVISILEVSLNKVGLRYDIRNIVTGFERVGILRAQPDDALSFRYRAFLEYFIACKMRDKPDFRSWILAEDRYLGFRNEILYYAGLVRHDEALLELIASRFESLGQELEQDSTWNADLNQIDRFNPPPEEGEEDIFDDFAKQMELPAYSESERDEILDGEIPRDVEDRQEVLRSNPESLGLRWTIALFMYSGVLKNLELIGDEKKRIHLRRLLRAWGNLTAISLPLVPMIARNRGARINGVTYEVRMPKSFGEHKVARLIYLEMPRSISQMLYSVMGTEKLERQLTEPELVDAQEPLIAQYYRNTLIGLLRFDHWINALKKLEATLAGSSHYLSEALLRSLADMYFLGGHKKEDAKKLVSLLGDAAGKLRGKGNRGVTAERNKAIQALNRRALLRQVRAKAADERDNDATESREE